MSYMKQNKIRKQTLQCAVRTGNHLQSRTLQKVSFISVSIQSNKNKNTEEKQKKQKAVGGIQKNNRPHTRKPPQDQSKNHKSHIRNLCLLKVR